MRNLKLLLATTALVLSATNTLAGEASAPIGASVDLFSPWTISSTEIIFPQTTLTPGGELTISSTGDLSTSEGLTYVKTPLVTSGTVTINTPAWPNIFPAGARSYAVLPTEIPMTITSADVNADQTKSCGKLTNLTQAIPASMTGNDYVIKYGGTFKIDADIDTKITSTRIRCHGSITATAINTIESALPTGIGTY